MAEGGETQAALTAFLKSHGLSADVVQSPNLFTLMIEAVQSPSATGLTWCNARRESCHPGPDGSSPTISRDCEETAASFGADGPAARRPSPGIRM